MCAHLMDQLKINRAGPGRPCPDRVRADNTCSSRAIWTQLRDHGIVAVIPQPADQMGHRKRRPGDASPGRFEEGWKPRTLGREFSEIDHELNPATMSWHRPRGPD
jgi:hypothetical protein